MGRSVSVLAALLAAALLAGCTQVRTTAPGTVGVERRSLLLVSSSQMIAGAEKSYAGVIGQARSRGRLNSNAEMARRVKDIGARLVPHTTVFRGDAAGWSWEFNVIQENTLNAWCMPGGKIAFYSGIIEQLKLDDEEIAAIMGHEIAHALREHGRERVSQHLVAQFGMNMVQLAGYGAASPAVAQAVQLGWLLPNSREHETESDRIGVELAARAGYDPRAAIRVWEKMRAKSGGGGGSEFTSTHPSHETRIADLKVYSEKVMHHYNNAARR